MVFEDDLLELKAFIKGWGGRKTFAKCHRSSLES